MSDIYVKRKKGESFEAAFRRWTRRYQRSGKRFTLQSGRFHKTKDASNKRKASKLRSLKKAEKREWLVRIGKLVEDKRRGRRR
ncbi:hypothetical protein HON52_02145 [Candidatus Uhrbacteria bacterium]|jgi:ribosomal protein S21|nr:hypothetical protein [Candidatus Uhrbacteria bacterium]